MFAGFFLRLRAVGVPVSLREYLTLIEAVDAGAAGLDVDDFYHLSRASLVKDERYVDRFDRVFGESFKGLEAVAGASDAVDPRALPEDWLRKLAERTLSDEEKAQIEAMGGWDALMDALRERLRNQEKRHEGGSKNIGTAGTSPFGAYGYNPEGVRIGQHESRHRRAVKVWDRRDFRDYDDSRELGVRSLKLALRRLRRWARDGAAEELDLDRTIRETASRGWLDVHMRPERHNAVKVLLFMDVGGSMDDHVETVADLFSAARAEFKSLNSYYFHNCIYEGLWTSNRRRWSDQTPTWEALNTYPPEHSVVFVGDASMSPFEIVQPGGAVEHWNDEAGEVWLRRIVERFPRAVWLNPVDPRYWPYTPSIGIIREIMADRMYPLTLEGVERAMKALS